MQSNSTEMKVSLGTIDFKPEPERLDLRSTKIQLSLGLLLMLAACLTAYWKSLSVGFLLDDFLHIDYVAKALNGNWSPFLDNFTGNWAGSDLMKSYRPMASLTIFLDYLCWRTESFGFHLTNVLLLFGCCVFVSLITLELSGRYGNRLGATPAIWAGLLFSVYPLHPEAVAWMIGRVDLLCGLFYLASVFCYLRFRLLRNQDFLKGALFLFLLALLSKEMAVTLPVVITLAELLLPPEDKSPLSWEEKAKKRLQYVAGFWLLLALYTVFRTALLGTLVGGYGSAGATELLRSWKVFLDRPTLWKILFPASEEIATPNYLQPLLVGSFSLTLALFGLRLLLRAGRPGSLLFLLGWCAAALVPTFQIWHIYPNLVGSRLFFISSAPFCILLALSALPTLDALRRWQATAIAVVGTALLLTTFLGWSYLLELNLKPWQMAGAAMSRMRLQLPEAIRTMPPGKKLLLLNLPTDIAGAGLITRPQYLEILSRPPFAATDGSDRLVTIEPSIAGSHDFLWPGRFVDLLSSKQLDRVLIWNTISNQFVPWQPGTGGQSYEFSIAKDGLAALTVEPKDTIVWTKGTWSKMSSGTASIEQHPDFLRIFPGKQRSTVYFPVSRLNPTMVQVATLDLRATRITERSQNCPQMVKLVWKATSDGKDSDPQTIRSQCAVADGAPRNYRVWLGRFRNWTLAKSIDAVGIEIEPGDSVIDFYGLKLDSSEQCIPWLDWDQSTKNIALPKLGSGTFKFDTASNQLPAITYTASGITNADHLKLLVSPAGTTFDAQSEQDLSALYSGSSKTGNGYELIITDLAGTLTLPKAAIAAPGLHQLRIVALDRNDQSIGFPSEPLTIESH